MTSCRLYAPLYKFNPLAEQRYLSLAPTKRVEYEDVLQYQFTGVNAGDTVNFLVSNGIADILKRALQRKLIKVNSQRRSGCMSMIITRKIIRPK